MELASKSLYQYLHAEKNKPSLQRRIKWAKQIAKGMLHLHRHGLAHCDLKSANVFLFEREDKAKVYDFGTTCPLDHTTIMGMAGSYRWMAPEFSNQANANINQCCDVFSYGMVLYEIFAHKIPFSDVSEGADILQTV